MVYGYVNKEKGETEKYFDSIETDSIIINSSGECDLSFLSPGDTLIALSLKTLTNSLKDMLSLAQFAYENNIKIKIFGSGEDNMLDSDAAIGQMMLSTLYGLNKFDDNYYRNEERKIEDNTKPDCELNVSHPTLNRMLEEVGA